MPPAKDLVICDTRQALLEWDFSAVMGQWSLRGKRPFMDCDPLIQTPLRAGTVGQTECWLSLHDLGSPACSAGCLMWANPCTSVGWEKLERIFSVVTKPCSQDPEHNERKTSFSLWFSPQRKTEIKTMTISGRKGINRKQELSWENLYQSCYTQEISLQKCFLQGTSI